ncbi:hypothetical protein FQ188_19720 [Rhodococcus sp. ANT_H53B]|nr:hypothetical protein FQ188_19720 [Rhodococcus sp. ANT_H53B]
MWPGLLAKFDGGRFFVPIPSAGHEHRTARHLHSPVRLSMRTLTDREANLLRDRVYRAVHIVPVSELIDGRVHRDSRSADDERQNP